MSFSVLGLFNAALPHDPESMQCGKSISFGSNKRLSLDIYRPREDRGSLPVVFFIYGGSWNSGHKENYSFAGHALSSLGFVTVIADYRLVPEVEYPVFLNDNAAALDWVYDHIGDFGGDATRLNLAGHSAGAYNAAMLALSPSYRHSAKWGTSIKSLAGLSGPYDFLPLDTRITKRVFGKAGDLPATQPVNLVSPDAPPMFLATGARDRLVFPRNTARLAAKQRAMGGIVEERHYPGLGHAGMLISLSKPFRFRAPVLADAASFMQNLAPRAKPSSGLQNTLHLGFTSGSGVATYPSRSLTRDGAAR